MRWMLILMAFSCAACGGIFDELCLNGQGDRILIKAEGLSNVDFNFYIDKFESSRSSATGSTSGTGLGTSCNMGQVVPWYSVTYEDAKAACRSAGKRLCKKNEWIAACKGAANHAYPYGNTYEKGKCATKDNAVSVQVSGASDGCATETKIFDMSGNLREWVEEGSLMGGGFNSRGDEAQCDSEIAVSDFGTYNPSQSDGFRCCSDETTITP